MDILEKLKQDFAPKVKDLQSFHCEEIGEDIYFRPVANIVQSDKYMPLLQENKIEGFVELVLQRALDKNGKRLFLPKDKADLMKNVDPSIIVDIGNAILQVDEQEAPANNEELREIEKKS